ncbi:MAG: hypothetical protein HYS35_09460 [Betaproteobacteria bacterium]|nr:hypothetical protein [Betaproteobacteria bacterium]
MGRDPRPIAARHRLKHGAVLLLALLVVGCGGNSNVQLSSGGTVAVQGRSTFGGVLAVGVLGAMVYSESHNTSLAPQLDASRRVLEQDCTKPIEDWSANLRCR